MMGWRNTHAWGRGALAGVMLSGLVVFAAEPPVQLVSVTREVPERGSLKAAAMVQGKERSSFIVPAGWRLGLEDKSGAVLLQSAEYAGLIEIRRLPLPEREVNFKEVRDQIARAEERREVVEDYAWVGAPCRSHVFDTFEMVGNSVKMQRRICLMVREDHLLVITLTAREQGFTSCLRAFEIVLASLREE
ncbi:hypothetical protein NXS98_16715 [Fontisphaera persica]|uniref:hypothetical protein n=1 Tax=Fontisphaera persica TaxID=2974023 RepID=UPI0024C0597C|nr:hypothetical protein [Fontisphaera persica]WCJ59341.1 hypothetical protein NXS98_16715 [Fontisphaera persica]